MNKINLSAMPMELLATINTALNNGAGCTLIKSGKAIGTVLSINYLDNYRLYIKGIGELRYSIDNDMVLSFY